MKQDYRQLLKPEIINTVSGMSLISRIIVDGFLNGLNHSRRVGYGMEFSQYRAYESGDDLRLLDWKMLARSGRYYIKQSEIETHISIKFILDASQSMAHREESLSKFDLAKISIASLAYLAQNQGDAVGLFALNDQKIHSVYPKVQKQHFNRLLLELLNINEKGQWPKKDALPLLQQKTSKELLFFVTDLYEYDEELTGFIKTLKTKRNEVVVLHLLSDKELTFDYSGTLTFEDLETQQRVKVDTKDVKDTYLKVLNENLSSVKNLFLNQGIHYHQFNLNDPIQETLHTFLKTRRNLL